MCVYVKNVVSKVFFLAPMKVRGLIEIKSHKSRAQAVVNFSGVYSVSPKADFEVNVATISSILERTASKSGQPPPIC